jgi:hypothetical protein
MLGCAGGLCVAPSAPDTDSPSSISKLRGPDLSPANDPARVDFCLRDRRNANEVELLEQGTSTESVDDVVLHAAREGEHARAALVKDATRSRVGGS